MIYVIALVLLVQHVSTEGLLINSVLQTTTSQQRPITNSTTTVTTTSNIFATIDSNKHMQASLGDNVVLQCPSINATNTSVIYSWHKDGRKLTTHNHHQYRVRFIANHRMLLIKHITLEHAGIFSCNIVTGYGNKNRGFNLTLDIWLPTTTTTTTTAALPFYDDEEEDDDDSIVENVNNDETNQQLLNKLLDDDEVGDAPQFVDGQVDTTLRLLESVECRLDCSSLGNDDQVMWLKDGRVMNEEEYGLTRNVPVLLLRSLVLHDSGNYTCEVSNKYGRVRRTFSLLVLEHVNFESEPSNKTVQYGQMAMFRCKAASSTGPRTDVLWFIGSDNHLLTGQARHIVSLDSMLQTNGENFYQLNIFKPRFVDYKRRKQPSKRDSVLSNGGLYQLNDGSLVIMRATFDNIGYYLCLLNNTRGYNYRKAYLNVIAPYNTNIDVQHPIQQFHQPSSFLIVKPASSFISNYNDSYVLDQQQQQQTPQLIVIVISVVLGMSAVFLLLVLVYIYKTRHNHSRSTRRRRKNNSANSSGRLHTTSSESTGSSTASSNVYQKRNSLLPSGEQPVNNNNSLQRPLIQTSHNDRASFNNNYARQTSFRKNYETPPQRMFPQPTHQTLISSSTPADASAQHHFARIFNQKKDYVHMAPAPPPPPPLPPVHNQTPIIRKGGAADIYNSLNSFNDNNKKDLLLLKQVHQPPLLADHSSMANNSGGSDTTTASSSKLDSCYYLSSSEAGIDNTTGAGMNVSSLAAPAAARTLKVPGATPHDTVSYVSSSEHSQQQQQQQQQHSQEQLISMLMTTSNDNPASLAFESDGYAYEQHQRHVLECHSSII